MLAYIATGKRYDDVYFLKHNEADPKTAGFVSLAPVNGFENQRDEAAVEDTAIMDATSAFEGTIPEESVNKTVEADREVAEQLIDELKNRQLAMITDFNPSQMKIFVAAQRHHLAAIKKGTMPYTSFLWQKKKTGKKIGVQVHSVGRRSKKNGSRTRRAAGRPTQPKVHNFSQNLC